MRDYFGEMNIDYNELIRYEDIETYYDEVQDYTELIKELQCDRVEALKQIVNKNREIERLNKIIETKNKRIKKLEDNNKDLKALLKEYKYELGLQELENTSIVDVD